MEEILRILEEGARELDGQEVRHIKLWLDDYKNSQQYRDICLGSDYYHGRTAIHKVQQKVLNTQTVTSAPKVGTAFAMGAEETHLDVRYEPYEHVVSHPVYKCLVDEKVDTLFGGEMTITSDVQEHQECLSQLFTRDRVKKMKEWVRSSVTHGVGWLSVSYGDELKFKVIPTTQLFPLYDEEDLCMMVHFYSRKTIQHGAVVTQEVMDLYDKTYMDRWVNLDGRFIPEEKLPLLHVCGVDMTLREVPFIPLQYGCHGEPLVTQIKTLIDDVDFVKSKSQHSISKITDTLLILKNAGGTDTGKILDLLQKANILKLQGSADVDAINTVLNTGDLHVHLEDTQRSLIKYGRSVDLAQVTGNPSGVALRLLFAGLLGDCNEMLSSLQESFELLIYFVDLYLEIMKKGRYYDCNAELNLSMNAVINESESLDNMLKLYSQGILSRKSVLEQCSFTKNVEDELDRLKEEK